MKFLTKSRLGVVEVKAQGADELTCSANAAFKDHVNDEHPPVQISDGQYKPSDILFQVDPQSYRDALSEYLVESKVEES